MINDTIDGVLIDTDEDGLTLILSGHAAEYSFNIHGVAHELLRATQREIQPWWLEMQDAARALGTNELGSAMTDAPTTEQLVERALAPCACEHAGYALCGRCEAVQALQSHIEELGRERDEWKETCILTGAEDRAHIERLAPTRPHDRGWAEGAGEAARQWSDSAWAWLWMFVAFVLLAVLLLQTGRVEGWWG